MKNENNEKEKRLATVLTAFLVTFVLGTAFALTGVLQVNGIVRIRVEVPDYEVYWSAATATPDGAAGPVVVSTVSAAGAGVTTLTWEVDFIAAGTARLNATMWNDISSTGPVIFDTPRIEWFDPHAEFNWDVGGRSATPVAPGSGMPITIDITWTGDVPAALEAEIPGPDGFIEGTLFNIEIVWDAADANANDNDSGNDNDND